MVEEQSRDVGVARLRRLVDRHRPHARLDREDVRAGSEQKFHHLRLTKAGGDHQWCETFGAAAVRVRTGTEEVDCRREITRPDRRFK
nr:hypothetical protein [Rhodococcus wratislaviensis]